MKRRRGAESGALAGCLITFMLLIGVLCLGAFLVGRLATQPQLGIAPQGPNDGATTAEIGSRLAALVGVQLESHPHATVVLTEVDLTTIARQLNPDGGRFTDPEVRSREGKLWVSSPMLVGPFSAIALAKVSVVQNVSSTGSHLSVDVNEEDLGRLPLPSFLLFLVDPRGEGLLPIDSLFNTSPPLQQLRVYMDCASVVPGGLRLSFHAPGVTPLLGACSA